VDSASLLTRGYLTTRNTVLLEKLGVTELVKKFPAFYGKARHWLLS